MRDSEIRGISQLMKNAVAGLAWNHGPDQPDWCSSSIMSRAMAGIRCGHLQVKEEPHRTRDKDEVLLASMKEEDTGKVWDLVLDRDGNAYRVDPGQVE